MIDNNINMGAKGYYKLSVLDSFGKEKEEKSVPYVCNVVTFAGAYDALVADSAAIFDGYYAAIGTGTTEITRSNSSLNAEDPGRTGYDLAYRGGNEVDNLDGTSTITLSRSFSFSLGEKVGTFSEVGVYSSSSGDVFIAGQLIKDEFGSPTTITILSDEQLAITYVIEWTVPNEAQLVGSGTVTDAASNIYNYEVYAQPYFSEYGVGASTDISRYNRYEGDEVGFFGADGVTSLYDSGDVGSGYLNLTTHDGSGVVTFDTGEISLSPTQGSFSGLVYLSFYGKTSNNTERGGVVNTTTNIGFDSEYSRYSLLIKFLDPITKTSSQSFRIRASHTITV